MPASFDPWAGLFIALVGILFGAFMRGEIVVRALYDEQVRRAESAEAQAEKNTGAVVALTAIVDKQAALTEERDRAFGKLLDGMAGELAGIAHRSHPREDTGG